MTKITLEEALKSKDNFSKFIDENSKECIKEALHDLPSRPLHIVIPQMTPSADGLCSGLGAFNDGQKCYVFWFINNEKEEMLKLAESLNNRFSEICGIFVFKPCLNGDKTEFKCLLKPNISEKQHRIVNTNTPAKQLQKTYWEAYFSMCDADACSILQIKEPLPRHYQNISIGKRDFQILQTINTQKGYVASELLTNNKSMYEYLFDLKDEIEDKIGKLEWDCKENNKSAKIRKIYSIDVNNLENHEEAVIEHLKMGMDLMNIAREYLK